MVNENVHIIEDALPILLDKRKLVPTPNKVDTWLEINKDLPPAKSINIMTFERNGDYVIYDVCNSWTFLQHYLLQRYYYTDKIGWAKRITHFMILGEPDVNT